MFAINVSFIFQNFNPIDIDISGALWYQGGDWVSQYAHKFDTLVKSQVYI